MLVGYSTLERREVILSELMRCSLLDCLRSLRANGSRLPRPRALRYAVELARGMTYLHSCSPPVLHRDLKPGNLLLDASNTIRISDFGLATFKAKKPTASTILNDIAEHADVLMDLTGETGSYRFMAPEVATHKPYGKPVDVYSFAMILFNVLDSRCPWSGLAGEKAARYAIAGERPPVPRDWDDKVVKIMKAAWSQEPHERPSFAAILDMFNSARLPIENDALQSALAGIPAHRTPPGTGPVAGGAGASEGSRDHQACCVIA